MIQSPLLNQDRLEQVLVYASALGLFKSKLKNDFCQFIFFLNYIWTIYSYFTLHCNCAVIFILLVSLSYLF